MNAHDLAEWRQSVQAEALAIMERSGLEDLPMMAEWPAHWNAHEREIIATARLILEDEALTLQRRLLANRLNLPNRAARRAAGRLKAVE
jgi:hypothetical protein